MKPTLFISASENATQAIPLSLSWFEDECDTYQPHLVQFLSMEKLPDDRPDVAMVDTKDRVKLLPAIGQFSAITKPGYDSGKEYLATRDAAIEKLESEWLTDHAINEMPWSSELIVALQNLSRGVSMKARSERDTQLHIDVCVAVDLSRPENFAIACLIGHFLKRNQFQQFDVNVNLLLENSQHLTSDVWHAVAQGIYELTRHRKSLELSSVTIMESQYLQKRDSFRLPNTPYQNDGLSEASELIAMWNYQQLFAALPDNRRELEKDTGIHGFSGNAIWFDAGRLNRLICHYTMIQIYGDRNDTIETRKLIHDKVAEQPAEMKRSYEARLRSVEKGIIRDIDQRIANLEIEKLFDKELFDVEPVWKWPEIARDSIAILNTFYSNSWQSYIDEKAQEGFSVVQESKQRIMTQAFIDPRLITCNQSAAVNKAFVKKLQDEPAKSHELSDETFANVRSEKEEKANAAEVDHLYDQLCAQANYTPSIAGLVSRSLLIGFGAGALALQWNVNWFTFMVPNLIESSLIGLGTFLVVFALYYFCHVTMRIRSCEILRDKLIDSCRSQFTARLNDAKRMTITQVLKSVNAANQENYEAEFSAYAAELQKKVVEYQDELKASGFEAEFWRISKIPQANVGDEFFRDEYVVPSVLHKSGKRTPTAADFEDSLKERLDNANEFSDEDTPPPLKRVKSVGLVPQSASAQLDRLYSLLQNYVSQSIRNRYTVFSILEGCFKNAHAASVERTGERSRVRDFESPEAVAGFLRHQNDFSYVPAAQARNTSSLCFMPSDAPEAFRNAIGGQPVLIKGNPNFILYFGYVQGLKLREVFSSSSKFKSLVKARKGAKGNAEFVSTLKLSSIQLDDSDTEETK